MSFGASYYYAGSLLSSDVPLPELAEAMPRDNDRPTIEISSLESSASLDRSLTQVSSAKPEAGHPELRATPDRTVYLLKYARHAEFLISREKFGTVTIKYRSGKVGAQPTTAFRHLLLDHVLPRVVAKMFRPVLHAALLDFSDRGIAIVGASGKGKSTLAAALAARGSILLSDDGLALEIDDSGVAARGTYPSLRLWPDSLHYFFSDKLHTGSISEASAKSRVSVAVADTEWRVRLTSILLLGDNRSTLSLSKVAPAAACARLVENAFLLDTFDRSDVCANLQAMCRVVKHVPVYSVDYQRSFEELPHICAAIAAQCTNLLSYHQQ